MPTAKTWLVLLAATITATTVAGCSVEVEETEQSASMLSSGAICNASAWGTYCGNDNISNGDPSTLYSCRGAGRAPSSEHKCAFGCHVQTDGTADFCTTDAAPPTRPPRTPRTDPGSRGVFQLPYGATTTPKVGLLSLGYQGYHDTATRVPGWDFMTPMGTPLVAPLAGKVIRRGVDSLGNTDVEIEQTLPSGGTLSVVLLHANYTIQFGQTLRRGDPIGTEASYGNSSEPHSHVSVHLNHKGFDFMNDKRLTYDPGTRTYLVSGDVGCDPPCAP